MGNIVKENHLPWYLNYLLQFDKWPIEGILILQPQKYSKIKSMVSLNNG